jgi:hypothetical protein
MFSQTKMMIYKIDGSVDSVQLAQIKNITFSTTSVPMQGLVAYYPFDGNVADSSGNGYNGTIFYATPTQNRFGVDNNSYSFDGLNDAIQFGDVLDEVFSAPIAKFSVSGWALVRSNKQYSSFIIGKNAGSTDGPYQWNLSYLNGYVQGAVFSDTAAKNYILLRNPAALNHWFHFVLVFDGSLPELQRIKLYVNGSSTGTTVAAHVGTLGTTTINSQQILTVGATRASNVTIWNDFLDGNVDDIRIYNRVLSDTEIVNLYLATE